MAAIRDLVDNAKEALSSKSEQQSTPKSQFKSGWQPQVQHQARPGLESDMQEPAQIENVPDFDGEPRLYKGSGKLEGRKAIITGGDSGIGRSTAVLFAIEGADSLIAYLPQEESDAQKTAQLVQKYGRQCHLLPIDIRVQANCQKIVDEAIAKMGAINILLNNASTQLVKETIFDIPDEQWLDTFNTNIHPMFYLSKAALKHMKHGDVIINNASINAYVGRPDLLDYTSTKGAIVAFTRGLSNQFVDKGIRVNAVAPGPVWTPLIPATMSTQAIKEFTAPIGRPGQPSEIATVVVFLASTDSSLLSGQTIHANGGTVVNG